MTVLLHADPLELIDKLQEDLLKALQKSEKDKKLDGTPLPEHPQGISLGKPVDLHDFSKGWVGLNENATESMDKLTSQNPGAKPYSLKGCGIKDDAILAFRFKSEKLRYDEVLEEYTITDPGELWNVAMPSYNDSYDGAEAADANPKKS